MGYAVKEDGSFRAVDDESWLADDEVYQDDQPDLPGETYQTEIAELNRVYQTDVDKFNRAFALALLSGGPSEATKIATIRSQYDARKSKHSTDLAALKLKYGV